MPKMPHATDPHRWADGKFRPGNGGSGSIGSEGVDVVAKHLESQGYEIVGKQVRLTNGQRTTVTDLLVRHNDTPNVYRAVEVKSGGASQTSAQLDVYTSYNKGESVWFTGTEASKIRFADASKIGDPMGFRVSPEGAVSSMRLGRVRGV